MSNRKRHSMRKHSMSKVSNRLTAENYAKRFLEALDTPKSLACYMLLTYGEHDQLVDLAANPSDYLDAGAFFKDYQAVKLLSKYSKLTLTADPTVNAYRTFLEAEAQCGKVNDRLMSGSGVTIHDRSTADPILFRAQQKISQILGPLPSFSALRFEFGPGAAYGVRKETSVYNKVSSVPECTFAMLPILGDLIRECPGWFGNEPFPVTLREGSELALVPKNAKTHRSICIEPLLNGFVQKGYGSYIRGRLKRHGVNLDDQGVNQKLAKRAFSENLATVDFASASDTISYGLVLSLLPIDWFEALDIARSPSYWVEGKCYEFNKFSSMGNAYTFELESLIFYALAFAVCESLGIEIRTGENLAVYGDDVIIPRDAFTAFQAVCDHVGFSVNLEKTNTQGPFFESCGHDYFMGHFVRPFFIREELKTLEDCFHVTNCTLATIGILEELSSSSGGNHGTECDRLRRLHAWCIGCIPRRYRYLTPRGGGDGGLHAGFDVAVPSRSRRGWDGFYYRSIRSIPVKKPMPEAGWPMAYALYFAGKGCSQLITGRGTYILTGDELRVFKDVPSDIYNSDGYTVRNRVRTRSMRNFWFGPWPESPLWGDESLELVSRKRGSPCKLE